VSDESLHPIADLACELLLTGGDEPYSFDETALERIGTDLAALFGDTVLRRAVADLLRVACYLDTEASSPAAAQALIRVASAAVEPLNALESADEAVASTKREFDRFRGTEEGSRAPKVGEDAPEGSVKLGTLDYPKRG
jgi:hypothetical protein